MAEEQSDRDGSQQRGGSSSYPKRGGKPGASSHGEGKKPYPKRDGEKKPHAKRDGEKKPYPKRDGEKKPYPKRDGDRKPYPKRDGDRKPYPKRDGDRKPYPKRDGDRKPYPKRDGEKKPYPKRDGEKKPYPKRDGDRTPYPRREGDRAPRRDEATREQRVPAPEIPEEITAHDLNPAARNELKTLSKENAEGVARHLAMAARLIEDDPALAHEHALAASRRAGRIAVVRETVAITAYATGDYALALRELRTFRRISGRDDQIALMVDSERGVGRPDRALEVGRAVDRAALPTAVRVELAIAMSGARLDLGEAERALQELDIPELDPDRAFEWSPGLFAARATVLEELGRTEDAAEWQRRADVAADVLEEASGLAASEVVFVEEIDEELEIEGPDASDAASVESPAGSPIDDEVGEILESVDDGNDA